MSIKFSAHPGPRERHLQRKYQNPLFAEEAESLTQQQVNEARHQDETELQDFLHYFQALVQEAIDLQPNTDSEVILDIKERLDQCYTRCCALPGDNNEIESAIDKLLEVIMKAVRQGAENDPVALEKLEEEELARQMHRQMQQNVLIADLLLPDSPIAENELIACLLAESPRSLQTVLTIFSPEHLQILYQDGKTLLENCKAKGYELSEAWKNLAIFESAIMAETEKTKN